MSTINQPNQPAEQPVAPADLAQRVNRLVFDNQHGGAALRATEARRQTLHADPTTCSRAVNPGRCGATVGALHYCAGP